MVGESMEYLLEFDEFIRSIKQNIDTKHSLLLGAGASVESGIPSANECIWEWKRDIFVSQNPTLMGTHNNIKIEGVKNSIQNWLDNQGIYPPLNSENEYSFYIEKAYKISGDRRKYFEHIIEGKTPSLGYHIIALLAEYESIKSVWTTNFDSLTLKTAHQYNITPIEVTLESQDRIFRTDAEKELLCIALHGDYKYGPLKNTEKELDNQSDILIKALKYETTKRNLIVIGYSGRDKSLMSALESAYLENGAGRLYWCGYGREIPNAVLALIEKINDAGREAFYIPTDGFDKILLNIAHMCFDNKELQNRIERLKKTLGTGYECENIAFKHYTDTVNKSVDTNTYPITFPKKCYQFEINYKANEKPWDYCKELIKYNIIAIPYNNVVYAWGNQNTILRMCANQLASNIQIIPIPRETFLKNQVLREMLLRALVTIIGRHSSYDFNKCKIWNKNEKFICYINGKKVVAYKGLKFSLFMDWKYSYISVTPSHYYEDSSVVNKDENMEFSKRFLEDVCKKQPNRNYFYYVKHWMDTIFRDKQIKERYPYGSDSEFEFQIASKSLLVGLKSKYGTGILDANNKKRILLRGTELSDTELKFYNPNQHIMRTDFHPMRGLVQNMPFDYEMNNKIYKSNITLGVISPFDGQEKLENFLDGLNKCHNTKYNIDYVINYPSFQGIYGIGLNIPLRSDWSIINIKYLSKNNMYNAIIEFADQINKRIEQLNSSKNVDVIIIYIPKDYEIFTSYTQDYIHFDLHDYIKAFAVQKHISTQIIREKTLDSEMDCQIAWAISLALYVKSGRTPWVLSNLRTDTAFAGIGYSLNHHKESDQTLIGCSHVYASDGQGLRYKLSKINDVTFDSKKNPYLSENEAYQLGLSIKELFYSSFTSLPKRVVIHKRTPFKEQEINGLVKCLGSAGIRDIDLIEITYEDSFRCFEYNNGMEIDGYPVRRGCCFAVDDYTAFLFTHGIAPSVRNPNYRYIQGGTNIPAPLKIVKHYGNGDLAQIASEILGLSKMNWNSFGLYSKLPCTIESSNAIAKVGWLLSQYEGAVYDYRNFM